MVSTAASSLDSSVTERIFCLSEGGKPNLRRNWLISNVCLPLIAPFSPSRSPSRLPSVLPRSTNLSAKDGIISLPPNFLSISCMASWSTYRVRTVYPKKYFLFLLRQNHYSSFAQNVLYPLTGNTVSNPNVRRLESAIKPAIKSNVTFLV